MKTTLKCKVWSNIFYLVPAIVGFSWGLWLTALLSLAVAFFGIFFHLSDEKQWLLPDKTSAWLLIISNLVLCYQGHFKTPYFPIACLFLILSLFYHYFPWNKKEYNLGHGMWHLYGSLITLFCIFTLVL
jgi:signal transduction histidine kinase